MNFNRAAVFTKVVELGGFSAAGRRLGMPKTTVSKNIADLEAELGLRLLNRTTRRLAPTDAGLRLYHHCAAALAHMDRATLEMHALQHVPSGQLTIAAPGAIAVSFLLPTIASFLDRHACVRATLVSVNEDIDLEAEKIDVLVWAGSSRPAGHAVRLVAQVEIGLFAGADYLASHGAPATPPDLAHHQPVGQTHSLRGRRFVWDLHRNGERASVTPDAEPRFVTNDPLAVMAAVAAGYGIGALPLRLVQASPLGATLRPVLPAWRVPPVELSALFRDAGSLKVRLFLDLLTDWIRHY